MENQVNHTERAHALLSASSAHRWLNCTPSAVLNDTEPDTTSEYAEEGTLAHELSELILSNTLLVAPNKAWSRKQSIQCIEREVALFNEEKGTELDPNDFIEHVLDGYVDYVTALYNTAQSEKLNPDVWLEAKLDYSDYVPEGRGTGDFSMVYGNTAHIVDLKYGMGKQVSAYDNPQLKLYALGAYKLFSLTDDIHDIVCTIHQPRLDHVTTVRYSTKELLEWGESIMDTAKIAYKGKGKLVAGDHCHFCKIKHKCPELLRIAQEAAAFDFKKDEKLVDIKTLSDEELLAVYRKAELLKNWLKAVDDHIMAAALSGKNWEGYKLVEGRSVRKIQDEAKALEILENKALVDPKDLYKTKLKGLGELEKLVGKKELASMLKPVIVKPPGKPTLVPASDKRKPITINPLDDFKK